MSNKRFWWSVLWVWVVMGATSWVFHGWWLKDWYAQTAQLWRPAEEMHQWGWMMWVGWAAFAWAFVWIWSKGLSQTNVWWQAVRYSWAIIAVSQIPEWTTRWATTPVPGALLLNWLWIGIVQAMLCAFVMTWAYKPWAAWNTAEATSTWKK